METINTARRTNRFREIAPALVLYSTLLYFYRPLSLSLNRPSFFSLSPPHRRSYAALLPFVTCLGSIGELTRKATCSLVLLFWTRRLFLTRINAPRLRITFTARDNYSRTNLMHLSERQRVRERARESGGEARLTRETTLTGCENKCI